jgi:Ca2+-binding RTX toxin-like protein
MGCLAFAVMPATGASAASFRVEAPGGGNPVVYYDAAPGETNDVYMKPTSRGRIAIVDQGVSAIEPPDDVAALNTCVPIANRLNCDPDVRIVVDLGDGDDAVNAGYVSVHAKGGPGADSGRGGGLLFEGGPGPDELLDVGEAVFYYGRADAGDLYITEDGTADDGHPGEGDNLRPGNAVVIEADGNHTVIGSTQSDYISRASGTGTTHIVGGPGYDSLYSASGDDVIDGGEEPDSIYADAGNNRIDGGAGNDSLHGGGGDDMIDGGPGRDTIGAGWGDDTIRIRDGESDGLADCNAGNDTLLSDPFDTAWLDCEQVIPG